MHDTDKEVLTMLRKICLMSLAFMLTTAFVAEGHANGRGSRRTKVTRSTAKVAIVKTVNTRNTAVAPSRIVTSVRFQPPATIPQIIPRRPTPRAVWISGYWMWDSNLLQWIWMDGYWDLHPRASIWIPGRWIDEGGLSIWIEGRWRL